MSASPFQNCTAVVTGASSGIGREIAHQLAGQGARVALAARRADLLEAAAADCRALGADALAIPTDVSEPEQCRALIEQAVAHFGGLDLLVNDAGITMWARFDQVQDLSIFEKVMRTNYLGALYCTYYALPHLKQTHGRIVAVSSLAGRNGIPERSGYAASKHAMTGFFDSLRVELRGTGVSVTVAFPGFVSSGSQGRGFGPDGQPLGRNPLQMAEAMTPEECARLVLSAAARRKREEVMTLRGKLGMWVKLLAPGLVDSMALKAIQTGK